MTNLEWALWYADKGFSIFPCLPCNKTPATEHGFKDATKDAEKIRRWWSENPDYNIGCATGQASGIIAIDIDNKNGESGTDSLDKWEEENGNLPKTLTNYTPTGGFHFIYKADKTVKNTTKLLAGIDVRGDGGYIILPPSVHPDGGCYEWENRKSVIAEADDTVFKLLNFRKTKTKKVSEKKNEHDTIPKGQRVDRLVSWIGTLVQCRLPENFIRLSINALNMEKCKPPLSDAEMEQNVYPAIERFSENGAREEMRTTSALDLYVKEIPPLQWFIDQILPSGTNLLVAPPKTNKSWFALAAGLAIAKGERFLGFNTEKAGVLYLALEDSERRLQSRMQKLLKGTAIPQDFYFATKAKTLNTGLIDDLEKFVGEHPATRFIIIDTLQKVRDMAKSQNAYATDYKDLTVLKNFADKHDIGLLIIHHTRKMRDTDVFNNISGTNGVLGAVDTALLFSKEKREDNTITLDVAGRDVYADTYKLDFSDYTFTMLGKVQSYEQQKAEFEYRHNPIVKAIKEILEKNNDNWKGTAQELADEIAILGYGDYKPKEVGHQLKALKHALYVTDSISYTHSRSNGKNLHTLSKLQYLHI